MTEVEVIEYSGRSFKWEGRGLGYVGKANLSDLKRTYGYPKEPIEHLRLHMPVEITIMGERETIRFGKVHYEPFTDTKGNEYFVFNDVDGRRLTLHIYLNDALYEDSI